MAPQISGDLRRASFFPLGALVIIGASCGLRHSTTTTPPQAAWAERRTHQAPTPVISAFGPNNPAALMPAIMKAYRSGRGEFVIPPGVYKLPEPHGGFYLSFDRLKYFRIIGNGVTLLRTDPTKGGIQFDHCRNVTLEGVTLRCDPIPYTQARIIAVGRNHHGLTVRICKGYAADLTNTTRFSPHPLGVIFSPHGDHLIPSVRNMAWPLHRISRVGSREFHLVCGTFLPTVRVGDVLTFRSHGRTDVNIINCADMSVTRVTVMGGTGMCFRERGGAGQNRYNGDRVVYPPKPPGATVPPLFASNADGFHSGYMGVRHGPTLVGCYFEGTGDDGIAIHGSYAMLLHVRGSSWTVRFPANWRPFVRPGDRLRVYGPQGGFLGETRAAGIRRLDRYQPKHPPIIKNSYFFKKSPKVYYDVAVTHPVTGAMYADRIDDTYADGSGFVVRNCVVKRNFSRGMLIKADNGIIEGNTIDGSTAGGIEVSPQLGWNESGCSSHLLIEGNTIRGVDGFHATGYPLAGALSITAAPDFHSTKFGHRGIVVADNNFVDDNGINLLVTDASGLLISGNKFIGPMGTPNHRGSSLHFGTSSLIWMQQCKDVVLAGNRVLNPGPAMKRFVGLGPDVSDVKGVKTGVAETTPAIRQPHGKAHPAKRW